MDSGATYRISVDLRELTEHPVHAVRLLLVADVVRRFLKVVESRSVVVAVVAKETLPPEATRGLQIGAVDVWACAPDQAEASAGPATLVVEPALVAPRHSQRRSRHQSPVPRAPADPRTVRVGAVTVPAHVQDTLTDVVGTHDPVAIRLALLRFAPASHAVLSAARLHRAEETIQRWRYKVAMWADMPAAPRVEGVVGGAHAALQRHLDTAAVVKDLHQLEVDAHIASGSKFATFAYLDRLLGLDLCHLVGKLRR